MNDYYLLNGQDRVGPYTGGQIAEMREKGVLREADHLWREGMAEWAPSARPSRPAGSSDIWRRCPASLARRLLPILLSPRHLDRAVVAVAVALLLPGCSEKPAGGVGSANFVGARPPSAAEARAGRSLEAACVLGMSLHASAEDRRVFTPTIRGMLSDDARSILQSVENNRSQASKLYGERIEALSKIRREAVDSAAASYRQGIGDGEGAVLHRTVLDTVLLHQSKVRLGRPPVPSEWEQDYSTLHFSIHPTNDPAGERSDRFFD